METELSADSASPETSIHTIPVDYVIMTSSNLGIEGG